MGPIIRFDKMSSSKTSFAPNDNSWAFYTGIVMIAFDA